MAKFVNKSFETRMWLGLKDPATGTTLQLRPGESVDLELDADFHDRYLVPMANPKSKKTVKDEPATIHQSEGAESSGSTEE
jgi:hypothetical protein